MLLQLGIFNINDKLTQYKINWREHIQRMDDNRLPKTFKLLTWSEKKYRKTTKQDGQIISGRKDDDDDDDFFSDFKKSIKWFFDSWIC